jgi:hypothetical protein
MINLNSFRSTELKQRVSEVPVKELEPFFGDTPAVWIVRALTSEDVAIMNEAQQRNKAVESLLLAAIGSQISEKAEAIKGMMGIGKELPDDTAQRIEAMILGSIDENGEPFCDRETAVRMSIYYPMVFQKITSEIFKLTGQGAEIVGKPASFTSKTK